MAKGEEQALSRARCTHFLLPVYTVMNCTLKKQHWWAPVKATETKSLLNGSPPKCW